MTLKLEIVDPEKYTDVIVEEIEHRYSGGHKAFGARALLGIYSVETSHDLGSTREKIFAVTAKVTSEVIRDGLAKIAQHDESIAAQLSPIYAREQQAHNQVATLKDEKKKLEEANTSYSQTIAQLQADLRLARESKQSIATKQQQLEADLAKVRMYFGDKAYAEALAGAKKDG